MSIDIDPEQINKYIADKVLESAIGSALRKVIDTEVEKLIRNYDNPITKVVEQEVRALLVKIMRDEYAGKLKAAIREKLTDELVAKAAVAALDSMLKHI